MKLPAEDFDGLAAVAGVHRTTLFRYRKRGAPMPVPGADLAAWANELQAWVKANQKRPPKRAPMPAGRVDELERMRRALADLRELDLQVRRGELVAREDVATEWRMRVLTVRAKLLALPRALAGRCAAAPPETIEAEAFALVRDMLDEFCRGGDLAPVPPELACPHCAAAAAPLPSTTSLSAPSGAPSTSTPTEPEPPQHEDPTA